ncbi:flagellar biosynthesis protein FlhA [Campylobacter hyointestinalis]|uniref:Flagellar biosynthesis protein FlhA n=1 Tax=Campylobacter hyointestinalis subsp. hyointestinalis TaxID=91352 RepID=A0A9W5EXB9_CAMHY|nr:flagellar biosynthesis protein FlhA [Campylobacter hyointestinalis]CUU69315.1 flagellar biosynthesis protein FlhA [Campylobacter hyointestinalis subsp. hyointestinalis]CUU75827.1 flagellar biosynthesis protein FlhA [Campylobacter hyointestinalis]CUU75950.1 flagellar biosynthesis protein FlhA [Campylobacter hyointestinalis subsp. hyointestinalis]CUU76333.1 flagellar biosynthesis protein FlhA [Campylobacter hyointestinalis subsp. hyointestinalis]CUU76404.1 flagellar biosynthesis protein FlhA 
MAKRNILTMVAPFLAPFVKAKSLTVVFVIIAILAIIIVPLPSVVLDFFLALSLSISVLIILISIYIPKPTDLSTFPTLILIITLFRLSLNIATTRMILSEGHNGPEAVSEIIASFGQFVVGGNYVIGVIVFCILVLINFMVVTKGSTRVSEVQARFTLDAMPGKQMAIDADLNAGLIDEQTARSRRQEIISEANFYGAMDGSSKFIKGDAVAGIIITIINIIGGFLIGTFQHDLDMSAAAQSYTILTIGDGLVSQIPGLITSTATAIIITRASKDEDNFAEGVVSQLLGEYKTLLIVGFILFIFAIVPGLPTFSLGFMAVLFLSIGYLMKQIQDGNLDFSATQDNTKKQQDPNSKSETSEKPIKKSDEEVAREEQSKIDDILKIEILELDLGYGLLKLADSDLIERIRAMRRNIASMLGFLMPKIRIRDNLQLPPNEYRFKLKGVVIASGTVYADKFLAMDSGYVSNDIEGIATKEPAFGLDALWIDGSVKEDAILSGYTVVDPASVISTHMSELVKQNASELLTKQEVQNILEKLKSDYPVVVEDTLKVASVGLIQKILKALLKDNIPIKDMLSILEATSDVAEVSKNLDMIIEHVRAALCRVITALYADEKGQLNFYIFDASVQQKLVDSLSYKDGAYHLMINVAQTSAIVTALREKRANRSVSEQGAMLLCVEPSLRKFIANIVQNFGIDIVVLSFAEIAPNTQFETLGVIEIPEI